MPEFSRAGDEESLKLGYEVTDASSRGIFLTGVLGLIVGFVIFLSVWAVFLIYKREIRGSQPPRSAFQAEQDAIPPEPRLQLNPSEDLKKFRAEKFAILNSAAWVDRKQGWVRIPIDDAMKLLVEERKAGGAKR